MIAPELLAPAGSFAIAEAAFDRGADAVYIGVGQLNLRAHSPNFAVGDLPELLEHAAKRGKKVYTALNIMPDEGRLDEVNDTLCKISSLDILPDAFIISDPGVLLLCKKIVPQVALHLSTQTGSFNSLSLKFWKDQGISRVVLPREFTLTQIAHLNSLSEIETEIFIHGAMCVSISGRCLLGAYLNGRHPNLGDCPQPCRFQYRISSVQSPSQPDCSFDVEENQNGVYLLNSKDLCTISILPQILACGVHSLKIEGRNKSIHYVASVVKTYREALDECLKDPQKFVVRKEWIDELETIEHRPYTTAFYTQEAVMQEVYSSKAASNSRVLGIVKGILEGGIPVIDVKNSFGVTDVLEVLPVKRFSFPFDISFSHFTDLSGNPVQKIPSNRLLCAHGASVKLNPGDMLRMPVKRVSE